MSEEGEEEEADRLFLGAGSVFDISQTEGEPLPEVEVPVLDGAEGRELYAGLEQLAASEWILVKWSTDELPENAMGMFIPGKKEIVVREAAPLQMTKTLAHELAHQPSRMFPTHEASTKASPRQQPMWFAATSGLIPAPALSHMWPSGAKTRRSLRAFFQLSNR